MYNPKQKQHGRFPEKVSKFKFTGSLQKHTSFAQSQACNFFFNMYLKYSGSSEDVDLFTVCRVDEINTGFIIGDMNSS